MTVHERRQWLGAGQVIAVCTLALMLAGLVAHVAAQYGVQDQTSINLQQATAVASLTEQVHGLAERIGKLEALINYLLLGIVGSIGTQLVQLRAGRK